MGIAVFSVKRRSLLLKVELLFTLCLVSHTVTSDRGYHLFGSHMSYKQDDNCQKTEASKNNSRLDYKHEMTASFSV